MRPVGRFEPGRESGSERQLRGYLQWQLLTSAPVSLDRVAERCRQVGIEGYVSKSFRWSHLLIAIQQWVGSRTRPVQVEAEAKQSIGALAFSS